MNVGFKHTDAATPQPIVFEQVFAEKPGGGIVGNPTFDILPGNAVGKNSSGVFTAIKGYRLVKAVAVGDTTIEIEKGSGITVGDFIAHGQKAVACTAVDTTTNTKKDVVTVTLGVAIPNGTVLYQAKQASIAAVTGVKAGYYDAVITDEDALKVVAADAGAGEVLLATVQASYQGSKVIAADDYVTLVSEPTAAVTGVAAEPIYSPLFVTGEIVPAGLGDKLIRLINGANLRKETANISEEVAALLPTINLV